MRIKLTWLVLLASLVLVSVTMLSIAPSHAQTYDPRYPFCIQVNDSGGGTHIDCRFTSMPQCQATASGLGFCFVNPYLPREPTRPQSRVYRQG
jgi:hypothetical protein